MKVLILGGSERRRKLIVWILLINETKFQLISGKIKLDSVFLFYTDYNFGFRHRILIINKQKSWPFFAFLTSHDNGVKRIEFILVIF